MVLTRACVIAVIALGATACGQPSPPAQQEAGPTPAPPPVEPALQLFVTDETTGNVVIVDPEAGQILATIPVGKRPRGLRLSPDGRQLLVALSGSPIAGPGVDESKLPPPDRSADGIGVIDVATKKLVRTLQSGQDPESFDVSADGKTLYVSNEETAEMSVLDLDAGTIRARVKVGEEPEGVTLRPDGRVVYVTCEGENEVVAIDTATLKIIARVKTGGRPRTVVFTPDGTTAFVSAENDGEVAVFNTRTHKPMASIVIPPTEGTPTKPRPMGAVFSGNGEELFVSLGRAQSVAVIDVKSRKVLRSIEGVGTRPWGIAVSPDNTKVYTANGPSGDISVIDVATGVAQRIKVGDSPWGLAVRASAPRSGVEGH